MKIARREKQNWSIETLNYHNISLPGIEKTGLWETWKLFRNVEEETRISSTDLSDYYGYLDYSLLKTGNPINSSCLPDDPLACVIPDS